MIDEEPERARKQISITDEFSEMLLLRPEAQDAARDRVVGAVMQRIRATPASSEQARLLRSSRRAKRIFVLAMVFACGALAGYFVPRAPAKRVRGVMLPHGVEQLDQLGLSETQRKRIDDILASAQSHTDSLVKAVLPALRTYVDSIDTVIRRELTPQQQMQFDSLRARTTSKTVGGRSP